MAVVCLAVAIGMTTAAFSVVHGAFFSDLPLPRGDRLVIVQDCHRAGGYNVPMTAAAYTDRRRLSRSFEDTGAWFSRNVTVGAGSGTPPIVARAAYVSPNALALVGLVPALGRLPATEDVAPP